MSLPPSQIPSPDHRSQAGASAISWWQKNANNISTFSVSSARAGSTQPPPGPPSAFPPTRISIPVSTNPYNTNPDNHTAPSSSAVNATKSQDPSASAPPSSGGQPLLLIYFLSVTHLGGIHSHPPQPSPLKEIPTYTSTTHLPALLISPMNTLQLKPFHQQLHGPILHINCMYRLFYPSTLKPYPDFPP
jgi:hypothetical protein